MYKAVDFYHDEIKRHADEIDELNGVPGDEAASEVEARLMAIALILRLMEEHGHLKPRLGDFLRLARSVC